MQNNRKRTVGIVLLIVGVTIAIGVGVVSYMWNKPHRDVQAEEASVELSAQALVEAYTKDQQQANTLYIDKVVAIKGIITEVDENHLTLEPGVYCTMQEGFNGAGLTAGHKVLVKGRVVSFDELFGEVRIDNAAIVVQ